MGKYQFQNEIGVPIVRIGCREFECIGGIGRYKITHTFISIWPPYRPAL